MEEKKKVYIVGRKGRGSEIIDTLKGLGAEAKGINCNEGDCVYFINHNNEIDYVPGFSTELAQVIMDNYKEIELPRQEWKDGDVLVSNRYTNCYAVFKKFNSNNVFNTYFILDSKTAYFDATAPVELYHLANTKEIEGLPLLFTFLMGALNEDGLCLPNDVVQNPLPGQRNQADGGRR